APRRSACLKRDQYIKAAQEQNTRAHEFYRCRGWGETIGEPGCGLGPITILTPTSLETRRRARLLQQCPRSEINTRLSCSQVEPVPPKWLPALLPACRRFRRRSADS